MTTQTLSIASFSDLITKARFKEQAHAVAAVMQIDSEADVYFSTDKAGRISLIVAPSSVLRACDRPALYSVITAFEFEANPLH